MESAGHRTATGWQPVQGCQIKGEEAQLVAIAMVSLHATQQAATLDSHTPAVFPGALCPRTLQDHKPPGPLYPAGPGAVCGGRRSHAGAQRVCAAAQWRGGAPGWRQRRGRADDRCGVAVGRRQMRSRKCRRRWQLPCWRNPREGSAALARASKAMPPRTPSTTAYLPWFDPDFLQTTCQACILRHTLFSLCSCPASNASLVVPIFPRAMSPRYRTHAM